MLKVLMLNHEFPPVGGGASPVTFELCKHLVQSGHRVDVVTMNFKKLPRFETVEGINIYRTPAIRRRANICHTHELATYMPGAIVKVLQLIKQQKYDIIHCHFMVPGGPLAYLVSKFSHIPFVVTCHGTDVPGHNPERFGFIHKLITPAWRFLAKRTNLITAPSQFLKQLIIKNCPKAQVQIIPNGIHIDTYKPVEKTNSILLCSRIFKFKGFQYAIQAIKDLQIDWQTNIIGEGPYLSELKELAQGSKSPIKFLGWLDKSHPDFYELFKKSSIFIFPSEAENFPTVLLEAMAAGMAIITSTAGGCPEVVADAGLAVSPRNTEQIKLNLKRLIDSVELRKKLSDKALARVKQFTWDSVAERFVNCYQQVIQSATNNVKKNGN
jgi:glycosyltransferase involved in cell wall biosynthesis